jgi:hypothetical protein
MAEVIETRPTEAADRQSELEVLFSNNYGQIMDAALSDRRLLVADAERITQSVAQHLCEYQGEPNDQAFMEWATAAIGPAVHRLQFFHDLRNECRQSVRKGIWRVLGQNLDLADHTNPSFILDQIEADTWAWALEHLDNLMTPGTAKLTTRLFAQGRFHALTWRKNRLREKERFDDADVERFGDESSFRGGDESDGPLPLYFDPGDEEEGEEPVSRPQGRPIEAPSDSIIAMKSGRPKMLCKEGCGIQAISSAPTLRKDSVKLFCGHERPVLLPAAA